MEQTFDDEGYFAQGTTFDNFDSRIRKDLMKVAFDNQIADLANFDFNQAEIQDISSIKEECQDFNGFEESHLPFAKKPEKNTNYFKGSYWSSPLITREDTQRIPDSNYFLRSPLKLDARNKELLQKELEFSAEETSVLKMWGSGSTPVKKYHKNLANQFEPEIEDSQQYSYSNPFDHTFPHSPRIPGGMDQQSTMNETISCPFPNSNSNTVPFGMDEGDRYDEMGYENSQDTANGRKSRGLRVLSSRVKEVVVWRQKTTYKEVADIITKEVAQQQGFGNSKEDSRDELNVKRRVYDALNVLIASGILQKNGKTVSCAENIENHGKTKKQLQHIKESKTARNAHKTAKIQQRQRELQVLFFKYLAIQNLVNRNKEIEEEKEREEGGFGTEEDENENSRNTQSSIWSVNNLNKQRTERTDGGITFPFMVVSEASTPDSRNFMNVFTNSKKTKARISAKSKLDICGEIDVLFLLKLHHVSKELFEKTLPEEIKKYVPSGYLESLN